MQGFGHEKFRKFTVENIRALGFGGTTTMNLLSRGVRAHGLEFGRCLQQQTCSATAQYPGYPLTIWYTWGPVETSREPHTLPG